MSLVTDHTEKLYDHVQELEDMGLISENEAGRLRDRINALEGDLQQMYDRNPESDDPGGALSDVPTDRGTDADQL